MRKIKACWNVFTTLLVALAVLLAVALVGVRAVGFQVYSVLSGSMEPVYHTGSLLYVKQIAPSDLKVGDVITFHLDETTVATHRIVEVAQAEASQDLRFYTKGDANNARDGRPVHSMNVLGTPVFSVPYLGYLAAYLQTPKGTYAAICLGAIPLLLIFLPELFEKEKKVDAATEDKRRGRDERNLREG